MDPDDTEPSNDKASNELQDVETSDEVLDSELEMDNFGESNELEDFEGELESDELNEEEIEQEIRLRVGEIEAIDANNGINDLVESDLESLELGDANELSNPKEFNLHQDPITKPELIEGEQFLEADEVKGGDSTGTTNGELIEAHVGELIDANDGELNENDDDYGSLAGLAREGWSEVDEEAANGLSDDIGAPAKKTPIVIYIDITEFLLCPYDGPELTHLVSLYDDYSILDCTLETFFSKIRSNLDLSEIHAFIPGEELVLSIPQLTEVSIAEDDIHLQNLRLLELISTYEKWCTCKHKEGPNVLTIKISFQKRFVSEFSRVLKEIRLGEHCRNHHAKRSHDGEELEKKRSKKT